ncbi:uncharacterized protein LOC119689816 [Teleopsis dalmanni]|uniref:uncharacterized protein LOC119689816 n=1 Tax=Teleopsis dalmanni TaxID=139649 RepID=UPI0018CE8141|nr:uncharacterized protein LOC119689816 [Teleopsis dalmanni]
MSIKEDDLIPPAELNAYFMGKFKCIEKKIRKLERQNDFYAQEVKRIKKEFDANEKYFDSYPNFANEGCDFDHDSWRYKLMDEIRETQCPPDIDKLNMFEEIMLEVKLEQKYKNEVNEEEEMVVKEVKKKSKKDIERENMMYLIKGPDKKCKKEEEEAENCEEENDENESDDDCEEGSDQVEAVCCH